MVSPTATANPVQAGVKRALHPGTFIGAFLAGVLLWLPSHEVGTALGTAVAVFLVVAALRAFDPLLQPVWNVIAVVPRPLRVIAGILIPMVFSITRFGASAATNEVERAQQALFVSILIAYVLIRPRRSS